MSSDSETVRDLHGINRGQMASGSKQQHNNRDAEQCQHHVGQPQATLVGLTLLTGLHASTIAHTRPNGLRSIARSRLGHLLVSSR